MGDTLVVGKSNSKRLQQIIRMCYKQSLSVILTEWAVNFHSFSVLVLGQIWFRLWVWPTYQMELRPNFTVSPEISHYWPTTVPEYPDVSQTRAKPEQPLPQNSTTAYPEASEDSVNWTNIMPESPKLNQKLSYIIYYERYNKRMKLHKGSIVFYWYRKNKNNGVNDNPECCKM